MTKNLTNIGMFVFLSVCTLFLGFQTLFTFATTVKGSTLPVVTENIIEQAVVPGWEDWKRPNQPPTVGLQVGHWKNSELPAEFSSLIGNTGASGGSSTELESNLAIAHETAKILESKGIHVDILPSTVPPDYWADAFIAIHADGSENKSVSGYKIAAPRSDITGRATNLVSILETYYESSTGLQKDSNITDNMRGYYAFSWRHNDHTIHPMTTAAIVETGFISNPNDRKLIIDQYHIPAQALADGLLSYLETQGLLQS